MTVTAFDTLNMAAGVTHLPRVPGALRGPADPEAFRIERRRQRWYHDPLPTCDIARPDDLPVDPVRRAGGA